MVRCPDACASMRLGSSVKALDELGENLDDDAHVGSKAVAVGLGYAETKTDAVVVLHCDSF